MNLPKPRCSVTNDLLTTCKCACCAPETWTWGEKSKAPKLHWSKELRQENERLKKALDYMQFQMRVTIQSRFDKYRNAKDTESTMAYRKCAGEIDLRLGSIIMVSQDILSGETHWDGADITSVV